MSYCIFNNLAKLINGGLDTKIGQGILSVDLMDRECNCYIPYNFSGECFYEGKFQGKNLIYEVKYLMCEAIYIGNIHQTFNKIMYGHFSDIL